VPPPMHPSRRRRDHLGAVSGRRSRSCSRAGELAGLLSVSYPKTRLADMVLESKLRARLERIVLEQRRQILPDGASGGHGTLFYPKYDLSWRCFDQIIVSQHLRESISPPTVLTSLGDRNLVNKKDRPKKRKSRRERHPLGRWKRAARYALIVSIRTPETGVDIYEPVANQVQVATAVKV